jgi:hypothetical protein
MPILKGEAPKVFEYDMLELNFCCELLVRPTCVELGFNTPKKLLELYDDVEALTEAENLPVPLVCGE